MPVYTSGARAKAWCRLIHAETSLCLPLSCVHVWYSVNSPRALGLGCVPYHASASGTVSRAVTAPIQLSISLEKEFYGKWLPVPCLSVLGRKAGGLLGTSTRPTLNPRTESARLQEHSP